MAILSSGLPDFVEDDEDIARFLTQSNQFNSFGAKPSSFLPNPKYKNTSVFRDVVDPSVLRNVWEATSTGNRSLKGAAVCKAAAVRVCRLDVQPEEPPPKHANIVGWPWIESDLELQKAQQLELAVQLASSCELIRL